KTYTANGHARSRKIWLVDWDKVGKVEEWRKAWAYHVNSVFQEKKIDERISEKTLEAQGINDIATQHVGVTGNRDERAEFNELVLENRQHKAELENLDEKINNELKVKQLKNFY
ncbi:MobA/MobL family protein, partial [Lactococcus lactis]|uniref:MobA/MobL family protein n=1 Tax=Lactococcus lactis TaxID=1358 RepID=UPI0021A2E4B7